MRITAKFDSVCPACLGMIHKYEIVEYVNKKAYHVDCEIEEPPSSGKTAEALADELGQRRYSWEELTCPLE